MIKLSGAVLLFFACAGLGFLQSRRYQGRVTQLEEILRIVGFLKGEISFAVSTLPEAMKRISEKTEEPFSDFLQSLSEKMKKYSGENFSHILESQINVYLKDSFLEKEDLDAFLGAMGNLGYLDKKMQIHILEQYEKELEEKTRGLRVQLPEKMKLYRSLGIMAGLFLILVFI